jgi:hypothetical protein
MTEQAITWWTEAEFSVVKQELARHTFRRKVIECAARKFEAHKRSAIDASLSFHQWWKLKCEGRWDARASGHERWRELTSLPVMKRNKARALRPTRSRLYRYCRP